MTLPKVCSSILSVLLVLAAGVVPLSSPVTSVEAAILVNDLDPTKRIAGGTSHTCAISRDDTVWCWGDNVYGQLGNSNYTLTSPNDFSASPIQVDAAWGNRVPQQIASGFDHSCLLMGDGSVWCWGRNGYGELGSSGNGMTPTQTDLAMTATHISAGGNETCAVLADQSTQCWGRNQRGQLGIGAVDTNPHYTPATVQLTEANAQLQFAISFLDVGDNHVCAGESNGAVRCWGQYTYGRLGTNTSQNATSPAGTADLGGTAKYVASGGEHTCVVVTVSAIDTLSCFGHNNFGQIAQAIATTSNSTPTTVSLAHVPIQAAAGKEFTCVLETANTVECFGRNSVGQLGTDTSGASQYTPIAVSGITGDVVDMVAGNDHACAVVATGEVWCWGNNARGQIGRDLAITSSFTPQVVGTLNVVQTTTTLAPTTLAPTTVAPTTLAPTTVEPTTLTPTTVAPTTIATTTSTQASSTELQQNSATTSTNPSALTSTTTLPHNVTRSLRKGAHITATKIAASVNLAIPKQSQGSMRIAITKGLKYCTFEGTTIKGIKKGTCTVLVVLIPKSGKSTERKLVLSVK